MNYTQSEKLLEKIEKAKNILLNCHIGIDPDSIASSESLAYVLKKMGKKVTIGNPGALPQIYDFLSGGEDIKAVDFKDLDYSKYDFLIMIDSEHWGRIGLDGAPGGIESVSIDHHAGNRIEGQLNILDKKGSSACEVLYLMFEDWGVEIDSELATHLLCGIYSDTGFFQFASTTPRALRIAADLIEKGADFNFLIRNLTRRNSLDTVRAWGEFATRIQIDKKYNFVWSAIPHEVFSKLKDVASPGSMASSILLRTVDGTNFAIAMAENEKDKILHISFRARVTGFDVSVIARELGGGGHVDAAGAEVRDLPFDKAVLKVLETARKYSNQNI